MYARFALIAAVTLTSVSAFAAEPVKPAQPQSSHAEPVSAQVVLASADDVPAPAGTDHQTAPTPPRPHRVARVTTCRCGDLVPQASDEQQ
jgi:hypothetical protein